MKTYELEAIDLYNNWILDSWVEVDDFPAPKPFSEWTVYELFEQCTYLGMGEGELGEVYGVDERIMVDGILVAEFWYTDTEWFAKEYKSEGLSMISSLETDINFE